MDMPKSLLPLLLGFFTMAVILGCTAEVEETSGPQSAEGEAISVVVDSITQGGEGRKCLQDNFSEEYIGNGTWWVKNLSGRGSWKVYENTLKATPDHVALVACY